jgi:hypothetical protein
MMSQQYTGYFPVSPRLMPLHSPGPVTPMELEEDLEYRFPSMASTPIKHSPLVVPMTLTTEEVDGEEEYVEIRRSR